MTIGQTPTEPILRRYGGNPQHLSLQPSCPPQLWSGRWDNVSLAAEPRELYNRREPRKSDSRCKETNTEPSVPAGEPSLSRTAPSGSVVTAVPPSRRALLRPNAFFPHDSRGERPAGIIADAGGYSLKHIGKYIAIDVKLQDPWKLVETAPKGAR